jgi:predicted AlkP superfamily pyrophosphatase or phosphodiesterase
MTSGGARAIAAGLVAWVAACGEAPVPKVLVVGIDGVRPDVLAAVHTPNLDALAADGLYSAEAQTGSPTVSGPGWSSLLIGVWPDKHGVTSNDFTANAYDRHPDFLTRLEQTDSSFSTLAVVDWRPLADTTDGGPVISPAVDSLVLLDGYEVGWLAADFFLTDVAGDLITTSDVDAAFVYLGAPDEVSHETGAIGEDYQHALAASDNLVGKLVEAVRSRPTYADEDWLIIVSSDHGRRDDGGHGGESPEEKTIPFLLSGPSVQGQLLEAPRIVDVAVTALAHMGVTPEPAWELDGRAIGISPVR